jgi:hypothetical protein
LAEQKKSELVDYEIVRAPKTKNIHNVKKKKVEGGTKNSNVEKKKLVAVYTHEGVNVSENKRFTSKLIRN